jgi:RNA polymerase sigma factor (sigma-70 family)
MVALIPVGTVTTQEEPREPMEALDAGQLVKRAAAGDRGAWEGLVDKYARLIWAITRDFRLGESDAADVAQATWLRLLEHIDRIEYPDRVGSWIAATARNECLRSLAARKRVVLTHDEVTLDRVASLDAEVDAGLLAAERAEVVREAVSRLPHRWQQLMELLMSDPPVSYIEISDRLGLPVGSIGPTRRRCLARLQVLLGPSVADPRWEDLGRVQPCSLDLTRCDGSTANQPLARSACQRATPDVARASASTQRPPAASTPG